jgi:CheY-like chemotaxis protein
MDPFAPKIGTILIINHERMIVDVITGILTDAGYKAYTVRDSADALAVIATVPPALIMLDIGRHDQRNAALIEQVRAAGFIAMPFVVISTKPKEMQPFLEPGMVECLAKPFSMDALLNCVARYVQALPTHPAARARA